MYKALCILLLLVTPGCAFMNNENHVTVSEGDQNNTWMIGWRAYVDINENTGISYNDYVGNITAVNGNFIKVEFDTQRYYTTDGWLGFTYKLHTKPTGNAFMWVPASWFNEGRAYILQY